MLKGNGKAISTVSGIVEGTGAIGAAALQLVVPRLGEYAFAYFAGTALLCAFCVVPMAVKEWK